MARKGFIRDGFVFAAAGSAFFAISHLLMEDHLTTTRILTIVVASSGAGIAGGLVFACILALFSGSRFGSNSARIDLEPGEAMRFRTPANHYKGIEAVGGHLYLTDKRLIFKSHKFNIQNHQLALDLSDIEKFDRYKTFGIINNGLIIRTRSGDLEKFVVASAASWLIHLAARTGLAA